MLRIESGARGGRADDGVLRCAVIERHHVVSTRKRKGPHGRRQLRKVKTTRDNQARHGVGVPFSRDLRTGPLSSAA